MKKILLALLISLFSSSLFAEIGRGKAPNENYDWRKRYSHKKLQKIKAKRTWCTYNIGN